MTGYTTSSDFPHPNAAQLALSGTQDAFAMKVACCTLSKVTLTYSTWLGGTLVEQGYGIAVDANGKA